MTATSVVNNKNTSLCLDLNSIFMYIRLVAFSRGYSHSTRRGCGLVQLRFFPTLFGGFTNTQRASNVYELTADSPMLTGELACRRNSCNFNVHHF